MKIQFHTNGNVENVAPIVGKALIAAGLAVELPKQSLAEELRQQAAKVERIVEWKVVTTETDSRPLVLHSVSIKGQASGGTKTYYTGLPDFVPAACPPAVRKQYAYAFKLWVDADPANRLVAEALTGAKKDPTANPNWQMAEELKTRNRADREAAMARRDSEREATRAAERIGEKD